MKIDISHLKMLFVEAKWLYNDALTFMRGHDINDYDTAARTVHVLDKDRQPVTHDLQYLGFQMKQSVFQGIKYSLKSLAALKKRNHIVGRLRYKSDYEAINLQQYKVTYRIGLQGIKGRIKVKEAKQFWNIFGIEFANARLLNLPDGYYLAITTSEGKKYKVLIEESERLKKLQRIVSRRKTGSSNRYRARKLLRIEYQKLDNKKQDAATKIDHERSPRRSIALNAGV